MSDRGANKKNSFRSKDAVSKTVSVTLCAWQGKGKVPSNFSTASIRQRRGESSNVDVSAQPHCSTTPRLPMAPHGPESDFECTQQDSTLSSPPPLIICPAPLCRPVLCGWKRGEGIPTGVHWRGVGVGARCHQLICILHAPDQQVSGNSAQRNEYQGNKVQ